MGKGWGRERVKGERSAQKERHHDKNARFIGCLVSFAKQHGRNEDGSQCQSDASRKDPDGIHDRNQFVLTVRPPGRNRRKQISDYSRSPYKWDIEQRKAARIERGDLTRPRARVDVCKLETLIRQIKIQVFNQTSSESIIRYAIAVNNDPAVNQTKQNENQKDGGNNVSFFSSQDRIHTRSGFCLSLIPYHVLIFSISKWWLLIPIQQ